MKIGTSSDQVDSPVSKTLSIIGPNASRT